MELGSSIPVPSVQEVAKDTSLGREIPKRYQRPDEHETTVASAANSIKLEVPVIDMQRLFSEDTIDAELQKLHHACKDWGFFQLINHGISSPFLSKVKKGIQDLFNLPMEEKKKLWQRPGELEGFGQAFVVSEEQKLDWADMFLLTSLPPHMRKSYLFDNLPPQFREDIDAYLAELKNITMKIISFLGKAMGIDAEDLKVFEGGWQTTRMNYYPKCPQPELAIGISPHSDPSAITILLQLNEMEGLQIRKDGGWVPIKPLPDAFVVNVGDVMEIVTNGVYRSIEHRAVVNAEKERLSMATFYTPNLEGIFGPAPSIITPENPAKFKSMGVSDYFKEFFKRRLEGKTFLDIVKLDD